MRYIGRMPPPSGHAAVSADSTLNLARRAGLLYLLAGSTAPFAYLYVPDTLLVRGDAIATADRVRASEGLLRAANACELYGATLLIFAAMALHQLFKGVDRKTSTVMAAMMLVSVPISYLNTLNHFAALLLLNSPAIHAVLTPGEVAAQVTLFMRLHAYGLFVGQILWGLWLFPIGILILRSGFIPRWLAYPLFVAGAGYVLNSLGIVLPQSLRGFTDNLQFLGVGEVPFFTFYLLIWGVRGHTVDRIAALLVVLLFVFSTASLVLLLSHRIDPVAYAGLALASLVILLALVMRWRWRPATAAA